MHAPPTDVGQWSSGRAHLPKAWQGLMESSRSWRHLARKASSTCFLTPEGVVALPKRAAINKGGMARVDTGTTHATRVFCRAAPGASLPPELRGSEPWTPSVLVSACAYHARTQRCADEYGGSTGSERRRNRGGTNTGGRLSRCGSHSVVLHGASLWGRDARTLHIQRTDSQHLRHALKYNGMLGDQARFTQRSKGRTRTSAADPMEEATTRVAR